MNLKGVKLSNVIEVKWVEELPLKIPGTLINIYSVGVSAFQSDPVCPLVGRHSVADEPIVGFPLTQDMKFKQLVR